MQNTIILIQVYNTLYIIAEVFQLQKSGIKSKSEQRSDQIDTEVLFQKSLLIYY